MVQRRVNSRKMSAAGNQFQRTPRRDGNVRRVRAAFTAACLAVMVAVVTIQPVAAATPAYSAPPVICASFWHRVVGGAYVVRNDNFGGMHECLSTGGKTGFDIAASSSPRVSKVIAFPSIFRGCTYGVCSPDSGFPVLASHVRRQVTSWRIRTRGLRGTWNAAYDLWFFRHRNISGQATGAELMIWLAHQGVSRVLRGSPILRIDGASWYLMHWRTGKVINGRSLTWNYVQFRRVIQTNHVTHLRLDPFIRAAEARGLVLPSWWLSAVMAGYEVWSGGKGLATDSFQVSAG